MLASWQVAASKDCWFFSFWHKINFAILRLGCMDSLVVDQAQHDLINISFLNYKTFKVIELIPQNRM